MCCTLHNLYVLHSSNLLITELVKVFCKSALSLLLVLYPCLIHIFCVYSCLCVNDHFFVQFESYRQQRTPLVADSYALEEVSFWFNEFSTP